MDERFKDEMANGLGILRIVQRAMMSLRHYLEDPTDEAITWESPMVELQYPVDLKGMEPGELEDWEKVENHLVETTVQYRDFKTLFFLTGEVAFYKKGHSYEPVVLPALVGELNELPEKERAVVEEELFSPLTLGGEHPDKDEAITDEEFQKERELLLYIEDPLQEVLLKRRTFRRLFRSLRFQIKGDHDGNPISGNVVVSFHPLVVDLDEEDSTFFPVQAGLLFKEGDPSRWDAEDHETFWEKLLGELKSMVENFEAEEEKDRSTKTEGLPGGQEPQTPETATTGTLLEPTVHSRGTFPLAFPEIQADTKALDVIRHVHKVRLPKKWSRFKSWPDLLEAEKARLLEVEGDDAFKDLKKETKDPNARGPLLKKRFRRAGKEEVVELTAEALKDLKIREGLASGFRFQNEDGKEYLTRLFQVGSGFLEVGLSWFGLAGPWVEDWGREREKETKDATQEVFRYDDLDSDLQEQVDRRLRRLQMLQDGRRLMEAILGQVGVQAQNPIHFPAVAFRELLHLHDDNNWKSRVEGGLEALRACEFRVDTFEREKLKGHGSFLSEWWYRGAGAGSHKEGDYFLHVTQNFLGCLYVFETGRRKLPSGQEITAYNFKRKLSPEEKKSFGWGYDRTRKGKKWEYKKREATATVTWFDAGRVFYNATEDLTPEQDNLVDFLDGEVTFRKDAARKDRRAVKVRATSPNANEPRLYGRDFCPLLPEGKLFHGALGHFGSNPETGRTLFGTRRRATATGGPHAGGLIEVLDYHLPPGRAHKERTRVVREAFQDFKAVVVDYLGGVVAAHGPSGWLSFEQASKLPYKDLRRTKWLFFLPETWREDRKQRWEEKTGWRATEDPKEAEQAREARQWEAGGKAMAGTPRPLRHRLREARLDRGLSMEKLGKLFGVSQPMVWKWETGPEPDEDGKARGRPLPPELVPFVERWVETGEPPSEEELAARKTRRPGVKNGGDS